MSHIKALNWLARLNGLSVIALLTRVYRWKRIFSIHFQLKMCQRTILWVIIVKVAHESANFRFVRNITILAVRTVV